MEISALLMGRYFFSDTRVRGPVDEDEVLRAQAYIVFYEKDRAPADN